MLSAGKSASPTKLSFQPSAWQLTLGFSCLILLLLELWRPFYFLGDDSLIYWLPLVTTVGDQILHGQSPAVNPYIFGGYNLLNDPNCLTLWSPLVLGLSLLANTRAYLAIVDIFCCVNLVACSLAFTLLLCRLRDWRNLSLSDGRIAFLSLSFTFSAYNLNIGACWHMFIANHVAVSLLALGLLSPQRKAAVGWTAFGLMYGLLLGHSSPLLYTFLFLSIFAALLCWANRSRQPLLHWAMGLGLGLLLLSPILYPAVKGFTGSARSGSYGTFGLRENFMPLPTLPAGFFGGYLGIMIVSALGFCKQRLIYGLPSCLASFGVFGSLPKRPKLERIDIAVLVTLAVIVLFLSRPVWLAWVLSYTPLFRSLRWPYREVFLLLFFAHLWMALRPVTMSQRTFAMTNIAGAAMFAISLALVTPWSFSPMKIDRELLLSGKAEAYWAKLKSGFEPDDQIISIIDPKFAVKRGHDIPYTLLGAFNYPALFRIHSPSGYVAQRLRARKPGEEVAYHMGSVFDTATGKRLLAKNPHLKALRLISLDPPQIELCAGSGCSPVEIPSYVQPDTSQPLRQ